MRRAVAFLLLSGPIAACTPDTRCEPIAADPTGDLSVDLVAAWDGYGIDSRIVWVFQGDGSARFVEPPNVYAPDGLVDEGTWSAAGDLLTIDWGSEEVDLLAEVDRTSLAITSLEEGAQPSLFTRSHCEGYGF